MTEPPPDPVAQLGDGDQVAGLGRRWYASPRACFHCGDQFEPARRDARFCATRCRVAAARRRNGARSRTFAAAGLTDLSVTNRLSSANAESRSSYIRNENAPVVALFVEPRGAYFDLATRGLCDPWPADRDARAYAGPRPVVAHPPCGPWSKLRGLCTVQDPSCAPSAVDSVRRFGGVLEHPAESRLWSAGLGLPRPGEPADGFGGWTVEVDQARFGHASRKRTWLYLVRTEAPVFPGPVADPGQTVGRMHRREASATPPRFALFLLELARTVRR
jgi:hypothetical protein